MTTAISVKSHPIADAITDVPSDSSLEFPRSARLLTAADYACVFGKNRRLSDRYWTLLVHRSTNTQPRLGLAISKKRAKRAVDRNRIKRIAREVFRQNSSRLSGKEIVIMNRDETVRADNATLRMALEQLISKAA